jgi:hypothetical protein
MRNERETTILPADVSDTTDTIASSGGSTLYWIPCSELAPLCGTSFGDFVAAELLILGLVESSTHSQTL